MTNRVFINWNFTQMWIFFCVAKYVLVNISISKLQTLLEPEFECNYICYICLDFMRVVKNSVRIFLSIIL